MQLKSSGRRQFLGLLGLAPAGLAGCSTLPPTVGDNPRMPQYGLAPGVTYLNTASLGLTSEAVYRATIEAWRELETNPVRMAYADGAVHVASDAVRQASAQFLGCDIEELTLTRSTTEAMNTIAQSINLVRGDRVLTTNHEHHGGQFCWQYLKRRRGVEIDILDIPLDEHDPAAILRRFEEGLTAQTRVISVSHVLTTNGLRMPVNQIAELARSRNVVCVVDGAQAVGQIAVNVREIGCHAYAAAGHKWLLGPKGTGFLYVSADADETIEPIQRQDGPRFVNDAIGVGNLPIVIGLGAAIGAMQEHGMAAVEARIQELREHTYLGLSSMPRAEVVSPLTGPHSSALVAVRLPQEVPARALHTRLRETYGIITKRVEEQYFNGIRLSAHIFNTEADIDRAVNAMRAELR